MSFEYKEGYEYQGISPQTIQSMMTVMLDLTYPVGCYFETTDTNFNPNNEFVGTWVLEDPGLVHVSAGTGYAVTSNSKDGGSADAIVVSHDHSVSVSGSISGSASGGGHTHSLSVGFNDASSGVFAATSSSRSYYGIHMTNASYTIGSSGSHSHSVSGSCSATGTAASKGSAGTGKNMPPYKNVNRWHRTA